MIFVEVFASGEFDEETFLFGIELLQARDFSVFGAVAEVVEADDREDGTFFFVAIKSGFVLEAADCFGVTVWLIIRARNNFRGGWWTG